MQPEPDPPQPLEIRRFECACGRHVATERGTEADRHGCCSRCRRSRVGLVAQGLSR